MSWHSNWLRALTPLGWLAAALVAVVLLVFLGHAVGLRWDPLDLSGRRLRASQARADLAQADAAARRLEAEGQSVLADHIDHSHRQSVAAARLTERAATQARSAHDADLPLDPTRAARLRDHDRGLCDLSPAVCAAAPAGPADGGGHALSAGAPADAADRG